MSVEFSGWEVVDDGSSFPGVELQSSQSPQNRGIYKMYHGTSVAIAKLIIANGFQQSSTGMLGKGVYVSRDRSKASDYPRNCSTSERMIFELRVRVGRVKRIDSKDYSMLTTWNSKGYDTAWVPPGAGLPFVPTGREEDCVFDPKRVKVVGIESAPNDAIKKELENLISKKSGGDKSLPVCSVCKRKTQEGSAHIQQLCWKCGKNICILMSKHFCP